MTDLRKAAQQALEACETALRHFTKTPSTLADSTARGNAHAALATLRAALDESPGEEIKGWVLVPVEPTEEMLNALGNSWTGVNIATWQRLIAAAQKGTTI